MPASLIPPRALSFVSCLTFALLLSGCEGAPSSPRTDAADLPATADVLREDLNNALIALPGSKETYVLTRAANQLLVEVEEGAAAIGEMTQVSDKLDQVSHHLEQTQECLADALDCLKR